MPAIAKAIVPVYTNHPDTEDDWKRSHEGHPAPAENETKQHAVAACGQFQCLFLIVALLVSPAAIGQSSARSVACLGKVIPGDGVIQVTGNYSRQGPPIVSQLLVKRGQTVQKRQLLARLSHFQVAQSTLAEREAEVDWYKSQVDQAQAGAKASSIAAQAAVIERLKAEVKQATAEHHRQRALFEQSTISESALDRAALDLESKQQSLVEAEQQFLALQDVRNVDVAAAKARFRLAEAARDRARVEVEQALIVSPIDGVILSIQTWPGERLESDPLLTLGNVARMQVEAEVHITDLPRIQLGRKATMEIDGLESALVGTVREIGNEVETNRLFNPDPTAFSDQRVVKVWIQPKEPAALQKLSGAMVRIVIHP